MLSGLGAGHGQGTEDKNRHLTLPTLPRIAEATQTMSNIQSSLKRRRRREGGGGSVCCPSYNEGEEGSIARQWSSPFWKYSKYVAVVMSERKRQ